MVLLSIVVAASWLLLLPTNKKQVIQFRADVDHFVEAHYAHESRRFSALIRFIGETLINGTSQSSATVLVSYTFPNWGWGVSPTPQYGPKP